MSSSFRNALATPPPPPTIGPWDRWLNSLDPDDQTAVLELMHARHVSTREVVQRLRSAGCTVGQVAIYDARRAILGEGYRWAS